MRKAALIFFLFIGSSLALAGTPRSASLRLLETSAEFLKNLQRELPHSVTAVTENTFLVAADDIPAIAKQSHKTSGHCGGFIDVTDEPTSMVAAPQPISVALPLLDKPDIRVFDGIERIKSHNIEGFVTVLSKSFFTRSARHADGVRAARFLRSHWRALAHNAKRFDIVVDFMPPPPKYKQPSVRITIPGSDPLLPAVVIGAHLDSINGQDPKKPAPGSDDDGSGIGAVTELYRVLLETGFRPRATVELFGYAAEELGLLGSRVIAELYRHNARKVRAVMQLDMVANPGTSKTMTFITDNTDEQLTTWTEQLYGMYLKGVALHDRCSYACSDHASWSRYGYPSVFPFESPFQEVAHTRIHTADDLWDSKLDAEYASQFAKLGYAFVVELAR